VLTLAEAIQAYTLNGAKQLGRAHEFGSIEVGKKADLVAFDFRRPHLVPRVSLAGTLVHNAQGRDVELVLVDGEVLVRDGRPMKVDTERICAEAEHAIRALWADAGRTYWENPT
jgi:5-methylthioadenosine/S-adenosylhomocysteine deaminase